MNAFQAQGWPQPGLEATRIPAFPAPEALLDSLSETMRTLRLTLALALLSAASVAASITVEQKGLNLRVLVNGKLFTEYRADTRVPCLYPLMSASGTHLTRQYPFVKGVPGEKSDHPHHTGFWFTHGNVNGHDFWHKDNCRIVTRGFIGSPVATSVIKGGKGGRVTFTVELSWEADGKPVVAEHRKYEILISGKTTTIDVTSHLGSNQHDITFGDTKEGSFSIRTAPSLRLIGEVAKGKITNSEGVKDNGAWGKRARWVAYHGPDAKGTPQVIAIFDHNKNLRHPTWWHARNYGLLTANPFGIRAFRDPKIKEKGDHVIKKGEILTQRYRLLLHEGTFESSLVEDSWRAFTARNEADKK